MNSFAKNILTGAALALGGIGAAYAVSLIKDGRGNSIIPAPGTAPSPGVNTLSPFPLSPYRFG